MSRIAVVTGGTRGIGAAIAIELKENGYRVAANYAGNDERARAFEEETGIPVIIADDPLTCVARGGGRAIEMVDEKGADVFTHE